MTEAEADLLAQQVSYYRARAARYDDWWFRRGAYALDPLRQATWESEVAQLESEFDRLAPTGAVLELACGTGLWTERLLRHAERVVAVDSSPEVIALNRDRTSGRRVAYVEADLFAWEPSEAFDVVFFSFWLSHVPPSMFVEFWDKVGRALADGGRAIFIDNRRPSATDPWKPTRRGIAQPRTDAGDGREYQIIKVYYEPDELTEALGSIGWDAEVHATGEYFVWGHARPVASS